MRYFDPLIDLKHPVITEAMNVKEICAPLFNNSPINMAQYWRYYPNGTCMLINTDPEMANKFFISCDVIPVNQVPNYNYLKSCVQQPTKTQPTLIIFEQYNPQGAQRLWEQFRSSNIIRLIFKEKNYYESLVLGSRCNHSIIHYYCTHFDLLKKFRLYFLDKAEKIIQKHSKSLVVLPQQLDLDMSKRLRTIYKNETFGNTKKIYTELTKYKCNISHRNMDVSITKRELECMYNLAKGKTYKAIGLALNINSRTVETHIDNIKNKLQEYSRTKLIDIFIENGLIS